MALSDRILVICDGRLKGDFDYRETSVHEVLFLALGAATNVTGGEG
jgi:ABC-type sugar transport system ATPase subunit